MATTSRRAVHPSHDDAARWVARRLQDRTQPEQIVRELRQDGVHPDVAERLVVSIEESYRAMLRPRGVALEKLVAAGVLSALAGGALWIATSPSASQAPVQTQLLTTQMAIAILIGALTGVAVRRAAEGRRGSLVLAVACAADATAVVGGHVVANGRDPADAALVAISLAWAIGFSVWVVRRRRARFELHVGESGTLEWRPEARKRRRFSFERSW